MYVRAAKAEDNEKLIAIEQMTPQGEQIKLVSERKDYFIRAKKFEDPILLVAEDEEQGDILGIMGVGPVSVRLAGETVKGGLIFDWRSNPLTQKGLPRHMFRLWQEAQTEIAKRNLRFIFGYVKEDNERSLAVLRKFGAQAVETKEFLTMPVHAWFSKNRGEVDKVHFAPAIDPGSEGDILRDAFGSLDLFTDPYRSTYLSTLRERYTFGKFTYGKSSIKAWDTNAEYSQRVLNMPWYYKAARPVFRVGSAIVPLPKIPKLGDDIRVWQLHDLILDKPEDLSFILERARLEAVQNHIDYLVICMNERDPGYELISRKAWVKLKYLLIFVPMTELETPREPTYFDVTFL